MSGRARRLQCCRESDQAARNEAEPVTAGERYFAVDVLRGFALLGILAMNIVGFGWPMAAYGNPFRGGGFDGLDRGIWFFNHLVFEAKMMSIFSMLFGAGLVLMDQRAEARGAKIRGVYYRRILWLLVIGLFHSYLIWSGDILVLYAETGLLLYFFRNLRPRTLIILGVVLSLLFVPLFVGFNSAVDYMKAATARVDAQTKAGEKPTPLDQRLHDVWVNNLQAKFTPNPEQEAKDWNEEMALHRGSYWGIVKKRVVREIYGQTIGFLLGGFLLSGSRMLLGMGLMKLGVFLRSEVATILLVDGRARVWRGPAAHGLRCAPVDRPQVLGRLPASRRHSVQLVRQHRRCLGPRRALDVDRAERRACLAHAAARGRRPHGALELSDTLDRLHDALLRLRFWPVRHHQSHRPPGDRGHDLDRSARDQPDLAGALPLRPGRMAVAVADLLAAPADATPAG